MKLASWNVNGYRAAHRHGLARWVARERPDVLCLQEVKARPEEVPVELDLPGYRPFWFPAVRQGYSGVATFCLPEPLWTLEGIGVPEIDEEGRVLTTEFGDFFVVNAYFPNSGEGAARLEFKLEFCRWMQIFLTNLHKRGKPVLLCGDFNIAHRDLDVHAPDLTARLSGCLPEERAAMDRLLQAGFVDLFRQGCGEPGHYTWWSYSPGERESNHGWRIDYFLCSSDLAPRAVCSHRPKVLGSDHCPVVCEVPSRQATSSVGS